MKQFFAILLAAIPAVVSAQDVIQRTIDDYANHKKQLIIRVQDAYESEIKAATEEQNAERVKELRAGLKSFLKRENTVGRLTIRQAVEEFELRLADNLSLETKVQRDKHIEKCIDWLKTNIPRDPMVFTFHIADVRGSNGNYQIYVGHCESPDTADLRIHFPDAFLVKMTEQKAAEIGAKHRLVVTGNPTADYYDQKQAWDWPQQAVVYEGLSIQAGPGRDFGVFLMYPKAKVIELNEPAK